MTQRGGRQASALKMREMMEAAIMDEIYQSEA